jgi:CheY-like chemotaxis protein
MEAPKPGKGRFLAGDGEPRQLSQGLEFQMLDDHGVHDDGLSPFIVSNLDCLARRAQRKSQTNLAAGSLRLNEGTRDITLMEGFQGGSNLSLNAIQMFRFCCERSENCVGHAASSLSMVQPLSGRANAFIPSRGHLNPEVRLWQHTLTLLERANTRGVPVALILLDAQMPDMDGFSVAERIKQDARLARSVIIMLTSAGLRGDAARCREVGIKAYLTKPIKRSDLLQAVKRVLGSQAVSEENPSIVTIHSLRESRERLRILLVEDNRVNQTLAVRLFDAGMDGYVSKPLRVEDLFSTIEEVLSIPART